MSYEAALISRLRRETLMSKFLPDDPREFVRFLRERAEGHAPGYDIAIYGRPHQWLAMAKSIEDSQPSASPQTTMPAPLDTPSVR